MTDTQWVDTLIERIRASHLYQVDATGGASILVRRRKQTIAQISRRQRTITFPFPPSAPMTAWRQVQASFPGLRRIGAAFVLTLDDPGAVDIAMRYMSRRTRIQRYAWQSQEFGP